MCKPPGPDDECLFYTRGLSKQAIELAEVPHNFLVTIWVRIHEEVKELGCSGQLTDGNGIGDVGKGAVHSGRR